MKTVYRSAIAAACLALVAAPLSAQAPGLDLKLNPRVGLYAPLTDLGEAADITVEHSGGLAFGLGLELDLALLPVGVRLNLDYATGVDVEEVDNAGDVLSTAESNMLAVVGDVMFRPLPRVVVLQPYLFAGGGLKQYDLTDESTIDSFKEGGDFTLHLGGGVDLGLGPLSLNAEVGDYISWYELEAASADSEMQHDLFVSIGFVIGLL